MSYYFGFKLKNFNFTYLIYFLIFLFFLNTSFASNLDLYIDENISAEQISLNQVDLEVTGRVLIDNSNKIDPIYQYEFIFDDDFIYDFKLLNSNLTYNYDNKKIIGRFIPSNSEVSFNYKIYGIISLEDFEKFKEKKRSFFRYNLEDIRFDSNRKITLSKLSRDFPNFFNVSSRKIIIHGENPTSFELKIDYINLYKTNTLNYNEFKDSSNLLERYEDIDFSNNKNFTLEYIDKFSNDESVYFIDYDILIDYDLISNHSIIFYISNFFNESDYENSNILYSDNSNIFIRDLILKKYVNNSKINNLNNFQVKFIISNPNSFSINNVNFYDSIPKNFKLIKLDNLNSINQTFNFRPFESKTFSYTLKLDDDFNKSLIYLPRAKINYYNNNFENKNIFSNIITLINDFQKVDKRVLIQKEIYPLKDNIDRVKIKVENIGNIPLSNFIIYENDLGLNNSYIKGKSWVISNLKTGETWRTFYDVNSENVNFFVPDINNSKIKVLPSIIINNNFEIEPIKNSKVDNYTKILITIVTALLAGDLLF